MSTYSVQKLLNDLTGVLHGQTINSIFNPLGIINKAARRLILDCDPMETKRITSISGNVYNNVWDYALPVDLKGNKVIDLFPQVNRYPVDVWLQAYNQAFDTHKGLPWSSDMFTILFNTGIKTVRINAPFLNPPIILDPMNAIPGAGTYTPGGGATAPVVDNVNYVANGGSLMFNLNAGSSTGNIADVLVAPIDLSAHLNQSTLFIWTYLPTPSAVTAIKLQWGTNSTNLYSVTTSVTQQNTAFQTGWNLLAFPWLGATVTGSPNAASIQYLNVVYTYNSTLQTGVRLDNINSNLGSILNMEYYSKYLFSNSAGVFQEEALTTSDFINLDTDSYNLLYFLTAYYLMQQQQGVDALFFDSNFFLQQYNDSLASYRASYKSEIQVPQSTYYRMRRGGYRLWGGRYNS